MVAPTPIFRDPVTRMYMQSRQHFDTLNAIAQKGSAEMRSLGELRALGQRVTRDDVMHHTLKLMQEGHLKAKEAAGALSQVPQDGPALSEWIENQHNKTAQAMGQLGQAHEAARKDLAQHSLNKILSTIADGVVGGR